MLLDRFPGPGCCPVSESSPGSYGCIRVLCRYFGVGLPSDTFLEVLFAGFPRFNLNKTQQVNGMARVVKLYIPLTSLKLALNSKPPHLRAVELLTREAGGFSV